MKTFEEYLKELHCKEHPMILDDDLLDAYDAWLVEIEVDDWIKYAEEWHNIILADIKKDVDKLGEILNK